MGSLWWEQCPVTVLCKDVAAARLSVPWREQGRGESLGQRFSTGKWRSCGIKELYCSGSHQQAPVAVGPLKIRGLGIPALLSLGNANPVCPCSGSHRSGGRGVGNGVQMDMVLLISRVLTSA